MTRIQALALVFRLLLITLGPGITAPVQATARADALARGTDSEHSEQIPDTLETVTEISTGGLAPWQAGETLDYRMLSTSGAVIGAFSLWAEAAELEGIEAWRLEMRKILSSDPGTYGVSRTLVDRQTLRPIRGSFRHSTLGNADAVYDSSGVLITMAAQTLRLDSPRHFDSQKEIYDNDQLLYLVRMLPLELGYRTRLDLLPLWTANVIETTLEVTGEGACVVPAGFFDCFEIDLGADQKLWISSGPERYPLQIQDSGTVIELSAIGKAELWYPTPFTLERLGVVGTLPPAWKFHEVELNDPDRASLRILDPNAEMTGTLEARICPPHGCPALQERAEQELAKASRRFDSYQLREGSWTTRTINGHQAITFQGDFLRNGEPWVRHHFYTYNAGKRLELTFQTPADHLEHLQPVFDWIGEHLEVSRPGVESPSVVTAR